MTKYYWNGKEWAEKKHRVITESVAPAMLGDLPVYESPLSGKVIDGRRERREEMKAFDVREVDPSERPYGAGEPKSTAQLKAEQKYMADRAKNPYHMNPETRERLLRGR